MDKHKLLRQMETHDNTCCSWLQRAASERSYKNTGYSWEEVTDLRSRYLFLLLEDHSLDDTETESRLDTIRRKLDTITSGCRMTVAYKEAKSKKNI